MCRIDGYVDDKKIAECFKDTFSRVYSSGNCANSDEKLRSAFLDAYTGYSQLQFAGDLSNHLFSWVDMLSALSKIQLGKASSGLIKSQHILMASPKLAIHLNILYNGLLQHSYVPVDFLRGVITPVVKDKDGDLSVTTNYRPVALSNIFAQLLERLVLSKIEQFLYTDDLQFGFKKKHSTSHAVLVLKSCTDYFLKHGSGTYVTFLDCSKAFDKILHHGIFLKLILRGVPFCFISLLVYWYSNMECVCKWNDAISTSFKIPTGVKQGGILSPHLFIIYVDDLLKRLRSRGVGCHVLNTFLGAILFADDLCLMAPTRRAMQIMLNICQKFCEEFGLQFNSKKSKMLVFGRRHERLAKSVFLNGEPIETVSEWRYLGLFVQSGKSISFNPKHDLRNFYSSFNALYNANTRPSETVMMHLLYSICIPNLTYAADVKHLSASDMSQFNVAVNNAIRKIFSFNRWESVRSFRAGLGYSDLYTIFAKRRSLFVKRLITINNHV